MKEIKVRAVYEFKKSPTSKSRYYLSSVKTSDGRDTITELLPVCKTRPLKGLHWVELMENKNKKGGWVYGLYLDKSGGKHRRLTGVFLADHELAEKRGGYGDAKNIGVDAGLLFAFSSDGFGLVMYDLDCPAIETRNAFCEWTRGGGRLCLV